MTNGGSSAPIAVFDCETTGGGRDDRIVEIAVVTLDPVTLEITDEYETLVNPERDIGLRRKHGITPSMLEAAPVFGEIAGSLAGRLHGGVLAAHNLQFDVRMLRREFERMDVAFHPGAGVCTYQATRKQLAVACGIFGIELEHQHRALDDARAAARLLGAVLGPPLLAVAAAIGFVPRAQNPRTLRREDAPQPPVPRTRQA